MENTIIGTLLWKKLSDTNQRKSKYEREHFIILTFIK